MEPVSSSANATTRRNVLFTLVAVPPTLLMVRSAVGTALGTNDGGLLEVSRTITGTEAISADVAARIGDLLRSRIAGFDAKLSNLAATLLTVTGDRAAKLAALNDAQVGLALQIAQPWYLGYVGTPSDFVLKDDAAFATFLEAQGFQKIVDVVPRPTYPGQGAGWWDAAPAGVAAPAMPAQITDWTFHPGGPAQILAPSPVWRTYATADHSSIAAARAARPGAPGATGD